MKSSHRDQVFFFLFFFTFLGQIFIHDQLSVPEVIQDGAEVRGVPVDQVGACLVLWEHIRRRHLMRRSFALSCWITVTFAEIGRRQNVESEQNNMKEKLRNLSLTLKLMDKFCNYASVKCPALDISWS